MKVIYSVEALHDLDQILTFIATYQGFERWLSSVERQVANDREAHGRSAGCSAGSLHL